MKRILNAVMAVAVLAGVSAAGQADWRVNVFQTPKPAAELFKVGNAYFGNVFCGGGTCTAVYNGNGDGKTSPLITHGSVTFSRALYAAIPLEYCLTLTPQPVTTLYIEGADRLAGLALPDGSVVFDRGGIIKASKIPNAYFGNVFCGGDTCTAVYHADGGKTGELTFSRSLNNAIPAEYSMTLTPQPVTTLYVAGGRLVGFDASRKTVIEPAN